MPITPRTSTVNSTITVVNPPLPDTPIVAPIVQQGLNATQRKYVSMSYPELYALKHSIDPEANKQQFFYIGDMIALKKNIDIDATVKEEMESRSELTHALCEMKEGMHDFTKATHEFDASLEAIRIIAVQIVEKIRYYEVERVVDRDVHNIGGK